jgi:hypothetical protein
MKAARFVFSLFALFVSITVFAKDRFNPDTVQSGLYDMGKMWTFDYPPVDYLKQTYQFTPDSRWFDEVRLSALRFADYCSASFVSEDGLVMTNHHCARESGTAVQLPGEDFSNKGFYAKKLTDERKVEGLYVDQLQKIEDITALVQEAMDKNPGNKLAARDSALNRIAESYRLKPDWISLTVEPITFYNGGKYALYGYKRYNDVRLVFMPEVQLGFFGGDYDNFTYPRYALDCSFFRVYDENGKPLKTAHYFKFSPNGAQDNELVFVVGNPGTTRRLATIAELTYRRDVALPIVLRLLHNRSVALQEFNKIAQSDSIVNEIFSFENSFKAYSGELKQLSDDYNMARKTAFERKFKEATLADTSLKPQAGVWDSIAANVKAMQPLFARNFLFSGNPMVGGNIVDRAYALTTHAYFLQTGDSAKAHNYQMKIWGLDPIKHPELEQKYLEAFLLDCKTGLGDTSAFVKNTLNGKSPKESAAWLIKSTILLSKDSCDTLVGYSVPRLKAHNDPLLQMAFRMVSEYRAVSDRFKASQMRLAENRSQLGRILFDLYGTAIPPDATFSLRINDGLVRGYDYNGTKAPSKTTFSGMYDRYYSFNKQFPWNLPQRWLNPPAELLSIPVNFTSTNDIIGGNSGSPIINQNREVVGVVFDGNIESLSGSFILESTYNRAVSVHSAGMLGAMHHIYKAKRLENELLNGKIK